VSVPHGALGFVTDGACAYTRELSLAWAGGDGVRPKARLQHRRPLPVHSRVESVEIRRNPDLTKAVHNRH
jgi:hypothetical protein